MRYVAFIRGINVGGKSPVPMARLRTCLTEAGLKDVTTYIQSGNVLFEWDRPGDEAARIMERCLTEEFGVEAGVSVISGQRWKAIVEAAPAAWGHTPDWKHNIFVLLDASEMDAIMAAMGAIKTDIETVTPGDGVIYQSMYLPKFGQTSTSRLPGTPAYRRITIRNYNTAAKLAALA